MLASEHQILVSMERLLRRIIGGEANHALVLDIHNVLKRYEELPETTIDGPVITTRAETKKKIRANKLLSARYNVKGLQAYAESTGNREVCNICSVRRVLWKLRSDVKVSMPLTITGRPVLACGICLFSKLEKVLPVGNPQSKVKSKEKR